MARKVYLSSDIATDEQLWEIAEDERLVALLWPWFLPLFDDWGRAKASPTGIKGRAFPGNPLVSVALIEQALHCFAAPGIGLITLYEVGGKPYMAIRLRKVP